MRLFVALTPSADIIAELQASTSALRELAPELRWTRPEQWHVTLAFLGEVGDEHLAAGLPDRLGRAARRHPPLTLSLGGGGRFGNRVLWTRVHGDRAGLRKLVNSVSAAARRCGLAIEQRPYRPHLTLARGRGTTDLRPLVDQLDAFATQPWLATRLYLVHSKLGAGADGTAQHVPTAEWPLLNGPR